MRLGLVLCVVLCSCSSVELAPRTVKTRTGPALERPIRRIVALRARCGSLSSFNRRALRERQTATQDPQHKKLDPNESQAVSCTREQVAGVDQVVRSALEFHGYSVIDSERVNAITAERREVKTSEITESAMGRSSRQSEKSETIGALFGDAPPAVQDSILAELGAEGLLNARILVGAPIARSLRRHVDVQVRLLDTTTGHLVWASRCRIEAGWTVNEEPIMEAARCAVDRITGARR